MENKIRFIKKKRKEASEFKFEGSIMMNMWRKKKKKTDFQRGQDLFQNKLL